MWRDLCDGNRKGQTPPPARWLHRAILLKLAGERVRSFARRELVCGRSIRILTMMQSCASAAKLRAAGPFSSAAAVDFHSWRALDRRGRQGRRSIEGEEVGFAMDSPLEGAGFEPSVPRLW